MISVIGVGIFIFEKGFAIESSPLGISLMSLAVFSAIGYALAVRKLSDKYNSFTIVTVQNVIGIFLFAPLFFFLESNQFFRVGITWKSIIPVLKLSVFASGFAFIFFVYAIKSIGVSKANAFTNLIPVFTAIFAFILLDEKFSISKIAGIFIVITGLFFSQINLKKITGFSKKRMIRDSGIE